MNYYNENDPKAATWLTELINEKLIPSGHVDTRSITDISSADLGGFTQCHFFAGIAGWSLALALAGWPENRPAWTGSCPCQPFSVAGKGKGTADERHLWPVFAELIRRCRPPVIFGEQVASADVIGKIGARANGAAPTVWLDGVFADLEAAHYTCGAVDIPAACIGAPHIRQRLYWVADAMHAGRPERRPFAGSGQIAGGGVNGRMADAGRLSPRRTAGPGETESGRPLCDAPGCGDAGRLVQPIGAGLEGYTGHGDHGHESGRIGEGAVGPTAATGDAGWMGDSLRSEWRPPSEGRSDEQHGDDAGREETAGGLGLAGAWSASRGILCRDGKTRRVPAESVVQRLVDGVSAAVGTGCTQSLLAAVEGFPLTEAEIPGRVLMLRGYGNAIVPQIAAEFIRAYIETA